MAQVYPIVGAHFKPPAKAVLQAVPLGTPLVLRPEPSNPYDANAVAVWISSVEFGADLYPLLTSLCGGYGWSLEDLLAQGEHQLGYVPAKLALECRAELALTGRPLTPDRDFESELCCLANGNPAVKLALRAIQ